MEVQFIFVIVVACLPFKPCSTPSPVIPSVGSSGGKKRRISVSNSGARSAAKNMKVELKKAPEKSAANASDDKVVSSSCEVDCSNAVSCSTSPKTAPSRSSLDFFVHATQKLEVTTSSTDGDVVDLTAEDESASDSAALSSTCMPADADVTPSAVSDDNGREVSVPVAAEPGIKTVSPMANMPAKEPAEMEKVKDGTEKDCYSNDTEVAKVQCSQHEDAENVQEIDGSVDMCVVSSLDGQNTSNDDCTARNAVESPSELSSSNDSNEVDVAESSICENVDNTDIKLSQATVVLVKLDDDNMKAAECGEKSEVSTTSANGNGDKKVTGHVNQKPKVR